MMMMIDSDDDNDDDNRLRHVSRYGRSQRHDRGTVKGDNDRKTTAVFAGGFAFMMLLLALSVAARSGWPSVAILPTILIPPISFGLMYFFLRWLDL